MNMRILANMNINFHGRDSACLIKLVYIIVVVPAFIITLHGQICNAQATAICNRSSNYTKGSEFESNLKRVLNSLVQHTSQTGFNTSVYGQRPNQIYGLLQCRGDATAAQCYSCSQEATTSIRQSCGIVVGSRIYYDLCYLRYENYSFIGQLDTDGWYMYNIQQNISKPDVFDAAVKKLFSNLSAEATSSSKLYASGSIVDSLSRKIYGLVECWRDISKSNCTTCLSETINSTLAYYGGTRGARGLMGSCTIRYETYSFFNSTALPPAPAEAPLAPPPAEAPLADTRLNQTASSSNNSTQINHSDQKSSNKIILILGVVGGLALLV